MDPHSFADRSYDEGIDLVLIWRVLKRYKIFIAMCTLICTGAAIVFTLTATPMYRAEAAISEVHDSTMGGAGAIAGQLGGLASLAGVNLGSVGGLSKDAHAILKSRRLAEQFIERYNLTEKLLQKSRLPPTLWSAVSRFRKSVLEVDEDRRTGVTTISIYWRDPKEAALWANDFIALSNEIIRNRAAADAQRNIGYLNQQLQQTGSVEVQHALSNLIESETKTLMLAKGRAEYAFSTIDPAVPPEVKASPKAAIVILIGVVLGIFAGLLAAIARYKVARYQDRAAGRPHGAG